MCDILSRLSNLASPSEVLSLRDQIQNLSSEVLSLRRALDGTSWQEHHPHHLKYQEVEYESGTDTVSEFSESSSSCPSCQLSRMQKNEGERERQRRGKYGSQQQLSQVDDLCHMTVPLTEDAIMKILHHRWRNGLNMTKIGSITLVVNSFTGPQLNQVLQQKYTSNTSSVIGCIAVKVLDKFIDTNTSQSVVFCGTGGSGKTHTALATLRQLFHLAGGGNETDSFKHLTAGFTVLQSLSSARTEFNANSSRMGQYIEVLLSDCAIYRTKIHCYWTDQCRIVEPPATGDNYHIFYQLLAGLTNEEKVKLHLQGYSPIDLNYLNNLPRDETADVENFTKWRTSLAVLGIPFFDVIRVLTAVLLLGNIEFIEDGGFELDIKGNAEIKAVAALLGVSGVVLYRGFTTRTHNLKGQVFRSLCDADTANETRKRLSKALYCRTVAAIVRRINSLRRPSSHSGASVSSDEIQSSDSVIKPLQQSSPVTSKSSATHSTSSHSFPGEGFIGLVDMPSFQNLNCNKLDQLCMNLCAETLQQFYIHNVFTSSIEIARAEDIENIMEMEYIDNKPCLDLLTCPTNGILTILDKETFYPKCSCENFIESLENLHQDHNRYFSPAVDRDQSFGVKHFAGNVVYDANALLEGNRDVLSDDIVSVFHKKACNFGFATHLFCHELQALEGGSPSGTIFKVFSSFHSDNSRKSYEGVKSTHMQDFQVRLESLLKTLRQSTPHFIRCIRPNNSEDHVTFDQEVVKEQLRVLQVLETTHLYAGGYPNRMTFGEFNKKYGFFAPKRMLHKTEDKVVQDCKTILDCLLRAMDKNSLPYCSASWALGTKHIFLSEEAVQYLELCLVERRQQALTLIQSRVRGWRCRKRWPLLKRQLKLHHITMKIKRETPPCRPKLFDVIEPPPPPPGRPPPESNEYQKLKIIQQTCQIYGLNMDKPPPIPRSRPYTVAGGVKVFFPQRRIMKCNYPDGKNSKTFLKSGDVVLVTGVSQRQGHLIVQHRGCAIEVPLCLTEVYRNVSAVGTKI
ncbi:myosin-I heavy chain-like isoform X3 [Anneissia japonica]|uniref:myosin-I heavy chain-like isoform X3 n=1 Tax=Anneissia japonica TaxID=1529436 RepID=UPI0014259947|nr:myosin-I heavy chain-like isoform X3 [Anneissia japonica]